MGNLIQPPWLDWAMRLPAWSPAALDLPYYLDTSDADALGFAPQPTPDDWNAEDVGTGSWTPVNATLTKETGSPGGTGSQVLRLASTGPGTRAYENSKVIIGNHYIGTTWARSVVTGAPTALIGNVLFFTGTTSTDWQYGSSGVTPTHTLIAWQNIGGGTCEYDNFTATNKSLAAVDAAGSGLNRLNDGLCKYAGVTAWTVGNSAVLTKEGSPQVLRVAYGGASVAYARQTPFTIGHTYRVQGKARSDGTGEPNIYNSGAAGYIWTGTTSTDWQTFDVTFVATGADIRLFNLKTVACYVEFAEMEIVDLGDPCGDVSNPTAAQQPYTDSGGWIHYDGGDHQESDLPLGAFDFMHDGRPWTFAVPVKIDTAQSNAIFANMLAATDFGSILVVTADGTVRMYFGNGTAFSTLSSDPGVVVPGVGAAIIGSYSGSGNVNVWVDGVLVIDAMPTLAAGLPSYTMKFGSLGNGSTWLFSGAHGEVLFKDEAITAEERANLGRYLADKYNAPLASDALTDAELATWTGLLSSLDFTDESARTLAAQPVIANPGFLTDTDWTKGTGWTIALGEATSDGTTANITQAQGIIGNRYATSFEITAHSSGSFYSYPEFSGPYNSVGVHSSEGDAIAALAGVRSASCIGSVDNYASANRSVAAVDPIAGSVTDAWTNLTAADQPWIDPTTGFLRGDGTDDFLRSAAPAATWNCLHNDTGCTVFQVLRLGTTGGYSLGNANPTSNFGFILGFPSANKLRCIVANGTGSYSLDVTSVTALSLGTSYVVDVGWPAGGALTGNVNGVQHVTGTPTLPAANDATNPLCLLSLGLGGAPLEGQVADTLIFDRVLSLTQTTRLRVKLATKHGITL